MPAVLHSLPHTHGTWLQHGIRMSKTDVVDDLENALEMIGLEFQCSVSDMATLLRHTAKHTSVNFLLRGAEHPAEPRYHGTSWKGLTGIAERGFLPGWGAGRAMALNKFKVYLPVVYTSPVQDVALWYPLAMVDASGSRIGERVAADAHPIRIALICKADVVRRHQNPSWQKQTRCLASRGFTPLRCGLSHDGCSCE